MSDVSNRTIVALLAVALVVSVAGTMYSVSELSDLGGSYAVLSGAQTASDTASGSGNINILANVAIQTSDATLSWGTGYVVANVTTGIVDSLGAVTTNWINTTAFSNPTITIDNIGSVDVNLTVESSNHANAESFLCAGSCAGTDAKIDVKLSGSAPCDTAPKTVYTGTSLLTATANNTVTLCNDFDINGQLQLAAQAVIPNDAQLGGHTLNVLFTAESIGQVD